eukprot:13091755-Heterocapsa_arctica.AAC.1
MEKLGRHCCGRGRCSRTGRLRQHLSGNAPNWVRWTLLAMPYPARLAHVLAAMLIGEARTTFAQRLYETL